MKKKNFKNIRVLGRESEPYYAIPHWVAVLKVGKEIIRVSAVYPDVENGRVVELGGCGTKYSYNFVKSLNFSQKKFLEKRLARIASTVQELYDKEEKEAIDDLFY